MKELFFKAVIFDLDGVITKTAAVHSRAWKAAFDEYLEYRVHRYCEPFREFTNEDYLTYVDGKPRYDGVRSFLASRMIELPDGDPSDDHEQETVCGIGNKKNIMFNRVLETEGVEVYQSTVDLIHELKSHDIRVGVASSSKNCKKVLIRAGLLDLMETRVDGEISVLHGLNGKPEPDIFVTASTNLNVLPGDAIVVEDASSGVLAGRNGGFGLVLGLAREENTDELFENGADIVVEDISQTSLEKINEWFRRIPQLISEESEPSAEEEPDVNPFYNKGAMLVNTGEKPFLFLDYDGTLAPIADTPESACMDEEMCSLISEAASLFQVAIISGRTLANIKERIGVDGLYYAGSYGMEIEGPGISMLYPEAEKIEPVISSFSDRFRQIFAEISGVNIEQKRFSVAVHYRQADESIYYDRILETITDMVSRQELLRIQEAKKCFELVPVFFWNKGTALRWIVETVCENWKDKHVIFIGDDLSDEWAFRTLRTRGTGIRVSLEECPSAADFRVSDTEGVRWILKELIKMA